VVVVIIRKLNLYTQTLSRPHELKGTPIEILCTAVWSNLHLLECVKHWENQRANVAAAYMEAERSRLDRLITAPQLNRVMPPQLISSTSSHHSARRISRRYMVRANVRD
jgi:hypothetical protein